MHIFNMFDKMFVRASRDLVKSLFKYLCLYHCFNVTFNFWKFYGVFGSGPSPSPEKFAQNPKSLAQNYRKMFLVTHMPCCGRNWRVPVTCMPMSRERLRFQCNKRSICLRGSSPGWVGWLLGVLLHV